MSEEQFRLCGGIFFDIFLKARRQRRRVKKRFEGGTDGLSEPKLFSQLIKTVYPDYDEPTVSTFTTHVSQYKMCSRDKSSYFIFLDETNQEWFKNRLLTEYHEALDRMAKYIDYFVDMPVKGERLLYSYLELLEKDDSIPDDHKFFAAKDGSLMTKREILDADEICIQSLMLGLLYYVWAEVELNSIGEDTYGALYKKPDEDSKGDTWKYVGHLGENYPKKVSLLMYDPVESAEAEEPTSYPQIENSIYADYLDRAKDRFEKIKTLLYVDQPRPFYDFYVCNDVSYTYRRPGDDHVYTGLLENLDVETLAGKNNFAIISGTGGMGKSMMMRHLLLDAVANYSELKYVPIMVTLKDYDEDYKSLLGFIYDKFKSIGADVDLEHFTGSLISGDFLILLDGLDELKSSLREQFERELDAFTNRFRRNVYVMSSRPYNSFESFNRFSVMNICPFDKEKGLELIDKLDFRPDEPDIKKKFRDELDGFLYHTHREFTENPLLLTIMLMTYEQFAEVPSKMHVFYREAYISLAQKHDASKGAYKRALKTGLSADRFSDYFSEFCARTYRDEKYELTYDDVERYFCVLKEKEKYATEATISASDFIYDVTANMCLMYYESGAYHFTHRSFQEYFCALYFSKQKDRTLDSIGKFFENKKRSFGDQTFNMLYDMIPEKVEEYIFLPYLKDLFSEYSGPIGFSEFLLNMYPQIPYTIDEVPFRAGLQPESYLYSFIINMKGLRQSLKNTQFPFYPDFVETEFVSVEIGVDEEYGKLIDVMDVNEVPDAYIEEKGEPDTVGYFMIVDVDEVYGDPEKYSAMFELFESDDFALKKEFNRVNAYYENLVKKEEVKGPDLFDLF